MTTLIAGGALLLAILGFVAYAYIQGRKGGIEAAEGQQASTEVKAAHAADEAAVAAPKTAGELDARLRGKGL